jgi:hypothetical protein
LESRLTRTIVHGMLDDVWLGLALACGVCGMASLAAAMKVHWQQAHPHVPYRAERARGLRVAGSSALVLTLLFCLLGAHPTLGVLLWVMTLTASTLTVAFTLAYRPHWLRRLIC